MCFNMAMFIILFLLILDHVSCLNATEIIKLCVTFTVWGEKCFKKGLCIFISRIIWDSTHRFYRTLISIVDTRRKVLLKTDMKTYSLSNNTLEIRIEICFSDCFKICKREIIRDKCI